MNLSETKRLLADLSTPRPAWGWVAAVMFTNMALQQLRSTMAHRYASHGEMMDEDDVHADTYNVVPASRLLRFLLPVGARLHALHHLAPAVPFHDLEAAHQRLIDWLPPESSYHRATATSVRAIVADLIASTRLAARTVEAA